MKTLQDWLAWQSTLNPRRMELGLDRVARVWSRIGPGDLGFPVITVGGTNGKGSCVALVEAMAEAAGYRSACYSSPHLLRYNERVRIAGVPVEDAALCDAFERIEEVRSDTALTYFELVPGRPAPLCRHKARPGGPGGGALEDGWTPST